MMPNSKIFYSFIIIFLLIAFIGCRNKEKKSSYQTFILNGNIKGIARSEIFLAISLQNDGKYKNIDSAISKNGKFTLSGKLQEPHSAIVMIKPIRNDKGRINVTGWIEDGVLWIDGNAEDKTFRIQGSATNDLSYKYPYFWEPSVHQKLTKEKYFEDLLTIINKMPSSFYLLYGIYQARGRLNYRQMDSLMRFLHYDISMYPTGRDLSDFMLNLKKIQIGHEAPTFKAYDTSGKRFSFASYKGKVVLLNFWASWCRPCIAEIPKLKDIYIRYHKKGFEIVGIAIKDSIPFWKHAIYQNHILWHNIIEAQDTDKQATNIYCITYIPQNILLSENGKIVAKNIGLDKLDSTIKKYVIGN